MDPILPLSIVKRKKVGMHHKGKAPTTAQQAPLEVVQEEPEPPSSASSTYSFDLSHSFSSPRSSYDSKGSVRTAATSPTPSFTAFDNPSTENPETTTAAGKEEKPTKMPCGTSFLHMGPPTPISTSPVPPSSPKPVRPPRNPLRQQRKPVPTAPLPPTPNDSLASHPNSFPRLRPPKVVPQPVIIQTPPLQVLRPQQSQPQLSVPRPATAPHQSSSSSSSASCYDPSRNTSTTSLSSTRTAQTTSNVALTQFEKRAARQVLTSRGRSTLRSETSDAPPVFVYAFLSDSIILSLLFTRDLQKDVQKQPARIVSGYEMSILEGGRSNYPLLFPSSSSSESQEQQPAVEGFLIYNLSSSDRRKIQDFPFHPHWRRASTPETTTPLFEMIQVEVDDGTGKLVKATTIAWRKDVAKVTGLKLIPKAWDVEKGRKACVTAYLSVYCSPAKSAERLKKTAQKKQVRAKDDTTVALRNVKSID
ncbi:hypothetical protein FRC04_007331 [Tulasnella sp. 424]|nr:hypothetical protein FRC04_007331 [Tulasnella sp. 424]